MNRNLLLLAGVLALAGCRANTPEAVLSRAAETMGATDLQSIHYMGSGQYFALGQSYRPDDPWPRFNMTSYERMVEYAAPGSREALVRTQAEDPPRGGGNQPLAGERRQVEVVSGEHAWNMNGETASPTPAAAEERRLRVWLTPHGFLKAALAGSPAMESRTEDGRQVNVISVTLEGKFQVNGTINEENLVEKVETWVPNPVLGDMPVEITYSGYQDYGRVMFPTTILRTEGGHPRLEINVNEAHPNMGGNIPVPDNVVGAVPPPVKVEPQRLAAGVWFLGGGSHNSVLVEFQDHVAVIEGPRDDAQSEAVIAEVKRLVADKPIRYVVNTHHHFDHSGGLRAYVAEGATIVTHEMNQAYYERAFRAPSTLRPDKLAMSPQEATFETVTEKHVLTDGQRTLEIHHIQGNGHNEGILMAYLPRERLLVVADVFSFRPGTTLPDTPSPFAVNLQENLQRLKLNVSRIAPIHGAVAPVAELRKAAGQG